MRMRLPDGAEGEFLVSRGSAGRTLLQISGSGAPPF